MDYFEGQDIATNKLILNNIKLYKGKKKYIMASSWAAVHLLMGLSYDGRDEILYTDCWVLLFDNCLSSRRSGLKSHVDSHLNFKVELCFVFATFPYQVAVAWYKRTLRLRCLSKRLIRQSASLTSFWDSTVEELFFFSLRLFCLQKWECISDAKDLTSGLLNQFIFFVTHSKSAPHSVFDLFLFMMPLHVSETFY